MEDKEEPEFAETRLPNGDVQLIGMLTTTLGTDKFLGIRDLHARDPKFFRRRLEIQHCARQL